MTIDKEIKKKADDIRNKIYGKEVRESLASGLETMSSDVVENEGRQSVVEGRQDSVESQWQSVLDETTNLDVVSAPEIIAARNGEADLKARLDKENNEVTAQLAHYKQDTNEKFTSLARGGLRVLIVTDIHYSTNNYSGSTPDERASVLVKTLNDEHDKKPVDFVFILGDLSDNEPAQSSEKLISKHLTRLKMPYFVINGNHDLINDENWNNLLTHGKNYSFEYGNYGFIGIDTFSDDIDPNNSDIGQPYTTPNLQWLENEIDHFEDKKVFIFTHYISPYDNKLIELIDSKENIVVVFQGHLHHVKNEETLKNTPLITTGQFSFPLNDDVDKDIGWGFQTLEINNASQLITFYTLIERDYPNFHQPRKTMNHQTLINVVPQTLKTFNDFGKMMEVLSNNKTSPIIEDLKHLDDNKWTNTTGYKQSPHGTINLIHEDIDIDTLNRTGIYFVNTFFNKAPLSGYLYVMAVSPNNYTQVLFSQYSTRDQRILMRSKADAKPLSQWIGVGGSEVPIAPYVKEPFEYVRGRFIEGAQTTRVFGSIKGKFTKTMVNNVVIELPDTLKRGPGGAWGQVYFTHPIDGSYLDAGVIRLLDDKIEVIPHTIDAETEAIAHFSLEYHY